jgi:hypothetical protein
MSYCWREISEGAVLEERDELWRVILDGVHLAEVPDEQEGAAFVHEITTAPRRPRLPSRVPLA